MNLRPKKKWLVSTIPEAETICEVCGDVIIYPAKESRPHAHNGACRDVWRRRKAVKKLEILDRRI